MLELQLTRPYAHKSTSLFRIFLDLHLGALLLLDWLHGSRVALSHATPGCTNQLWAKRLSKMETAETWSSECMWKWMKSPESKQDSKKNKLVTSSVTLWKFMVESPVGKKLADLSTPADFAMLARAWIQCHPTKASCALVVKKYKQMWSKNTSHLGNLFLLESCWRSLISEHPVTWHLHVSETKSKTYRTKSLLVKAALEMKKHHSINGSKLFSCLSWEQSKWIAKTLFWIWTQGYIHIISMHGSSQGMLFLLSSYGPSMSSRSSSVTSRSALHFAIRDVHRKFQCCKNSIRWFKRAFASVYDISKHKAICLVDTRLSMPKIPWEFCETACEYSVTDPFPGVVGLRLFRLLTIAAKLAGEPHQVELKFSYSRVKKNVSSSCASWKIKVCTRSVRHLELRGIRFVWFPAQPEALPLSWPSKCRCRFAFSQRRSASSQNLCHTFCSSTQIPNTTKRNTMKYIHIIYTHDYILYI